VIDQALLLTGPETSADAKNLGKVLSFFGVSWRALTAVEFLADGFDPDRGDVKYRLFCSGEILESLLSSLDTSRISQWQSRIHSVFAYGIGSDSFSAALTRVAGRNASVAGDHVVSEPWRVTDAYPEFCGPLTGLRILPPPGTRESGIVINHPTSQILEIVSSGKILSLVRLLYHEVPIFISAASRVLDIDAVLSHANFDIRNDFAASAPVVAYVKWAFAETCWKAPGTRGCVVIDDPLLRRQYGFLNFRDLLSAMERFNFSTNIAFIPWNWRRNAADVVQLFKSNPSRYSLSIHGCDHTGGEFGMPDVGRADSKALTAVDRMDRLQSATGISYDRIMVFPQGVFSGPAMSALKERNFVAAVNTEVVSTDGGCQIRTSDVWDVAVMNYSEFPIFTRRYPRQGAENFAFDILLGKPCLVVIHHEDCRAHLKDLTEFIERLNALHCDISWCSLGDVVRGSYRYRELEKGIVEIEAYGRELDLANTSTQRKHYRVRKQERTLPSNLKVVAGPAEIPSRSENGYVHFEIDLDAGESTRIRLEYRGGARESARAESMKYRVKTALRRYLSEVRDNYVATGRYYMVEARKSRGKVEPQVAP